MKHTWTLFLLFILLSNTKISAQETSDLQVKVTTTEDLRVQLTAQNKTGKKLYLSVLMQDHTAFNRMSEAEIYSEEISGDFSSFNRVLNLSQLESGTYRISIKAGKQHFNRFLNIRAKPVTDNSRTIIFQ